MIAVRRLSLAGVRAARRAGDRWLLGEALSNLGAVGLIVGDYDGAAAALDEGATLARALAMPRLMALLDWQLGHVAQLTGDLDAARRRYEQSLARARALDDPSRLATALASLGRVAQLRGDWPGARVLLEESLTLLRGLGTATKGAHIAGVLCHLGLVARGERRHDEAERLFRECFGLLDRRGYGGGLANPLEGLALVAIDRGEMARGVVLLGAAAALRRADGLAPMAPVERPSYDAMLAAARAALGEAAYATAWGRGQTLTRARIVRLALAGLDG